ncbi:cytochrome-c oxidase, cbb3-type subunit II [Wenzhouxiangella marina]|uniref:Peptidase S41 n=1 Tax=Wenzhouxiangella marina TaxID=1579979 RepID=A0A0K0XZK7_9GAMM|nr:cytochrome-c oxidase, cbb3-type subunit II [Wenzhouxiangella marina]AKS43105.1 peptidase S41 [Wenzhouxiangella marina]MBB6087210.1 cytochrome c oxidase cbb3-type subunit 2 [Wenzhouxiangella marina]
MLHEKIEKNAALLGVLIVIAISFGGLVEIVPLMFKGAVVEPAEGVEPYSPIRLAGRDVYVREGCYNCHSQQIRPFRSETERYGHYSVAGEFVYDRPFQWGSKRTGPDLARVGGRYSDDWHELHLINPRAVVPESNMPAYPWLAERVVDGQTLQAHMRALQRLGDPYTDEQIEGAALEVAGTTELEALIAYLQGLGTEWTGQRVAPRAGGDS